MSTSASAQEVVFILSDVDGVLTDGGIIYDNQGIETKRFHTRDGLGIKLWTQAGFRFGLLTGRVSTSSNYAPPSWESIRYDRASKTNFLQPAHFSKSSI